MFAALGGHADLLEILLRIRADANVADMQGMTALMQAAAGAHFHAADVLLRNRADAAATAKDGGTALMLASVGGDERTVKRLLDVLDGGAVDAADEAGSTAVHAAACRGHAGALHCMAEPTPTFETAGARLR